MNIKVSKVFAKFINTTAKEMGYEAHAEVIALRSSAYTFATGTDRWDGECDYDWEHDTYRVIEVSYPYEYYATRRFLTTHELVKEFRKRGVSTADELKKMLRDMLEV
jgi:hypothetical protein